MRLKKFLHNNVSISATKNHSAKQVFLANAWRDLYIALGSSLGNGAWSVRIYFEPFVRWIWFGGFMLLIGGFVSICAYLTTRGRQS